MQLMDESERRSPLELDKMAAAVGSPDIAVDEGIRVDSSTTSEDRGIDGETASPSIIRPSLLLRLRLVIRCNERK